MKAMDMRKRIDLELRGKDPETVILKETFKLSKNYKSYLNKKNLKDQRTKSR